MPTLASFEVVESLARAYLSAAALPAASPTSLRNLLLQVDCEVLKLYSLPRALEQSLLSLFKGWQRVGVPFKQERYLPQELEDHLRFSEFLEFEEDWSATNQERGILIDKSIAGALTLQEQRRLDALQIYADYHVEQTAPRSARALDDLERRLFLGSKSKD